MFSLKPDLARALNRATARTSDVRLQWLDAPPPGFDALRRSVRLPRTADLAECGSALLSWDVHRRAGLRVVADGSARPGTTVALAARVGPIWAVAPCRVIDAADDPHRVGFTYVTLPGHPEHGIEEFAFVRDESGLRFDVRAVSRPALRVSRVLPLPQRAVQRLFVRHYLEVAIGLAAGSP